MVLPLLSEGRILRKAAPRRDKAGGYDEVSLQHAWDGYADHRAQKEPALEKARWRHVLALQKLMCERCPVPLVGREDALYERMHRMNPEPLISRSRFLTVCRRVFGFELAPTSGAVDHEAKGILEALFDAFDVEGSGSVEWRGIVLMLGVVNEPLKTPYQHLSWGFTLLGANGSFVDDARYAGSSIRLGDVKILFKTLGCCGTRSALLAAVDASWAHLCSVDEMAAKKHRAAATRRLLASDRGNLSRPLLDAGPGDSCVLDARLFDALIATRPLADAVLETAVPFGRQDERPWTFRIEEESYDRTVLTAIRAVRLRRRHDEAADAFAKKHMFRERRIIVGWALTSASSRRLKRGTLKKLRGSVDRVMHFAFEKWCREVLVQIRARELQRVARGGLGRAEVKWVQGVRRLVVSVQCGIRRCAARNVYSRAAAKRRWAATEMQRLCRGVLASNRTSAKLAERVDRGRRVLKRQRLAWEDRGRFRAASMVQRLWRMKVAVIAAAYHRQRAADKAAAEGGMARLACDNARKRRIYEIQMEEFYKEQKATHDEATLSFEFSNAEKAKIARHRRRGKFDENKDRESRKRDVERLLEEDRIAGWISRWEDTKSARRAALALHLDFCRYSAETPKERVLRSELQKQIVERRKHVFARARKAQIPLELDEATEQAWQEVLLKRLTDEDSAVDSERKAAAAEYYKREEVEAQAKRVSTSEALSRDQNASARRLQHMWTLFKARKLLRDRCRARFEKVYDEKARAYYYLDKGTAKPQWRKPYCLGAYDLDMPSTWVIFRDETDVPYYFNPALLTMSWTAPQGTVLCAECEERFCDMVDNVSQQYLCSACYARARADDYEYADDDEALRKLSWKPVDGSRPTASTLRLNDIEDECEFGNVKQLMVQLDLPPEPEPVVSAKVEKMLSRRLSAISMTQEQLLSFRPQDPSAETLLDQAQREAMALMHCAKARQRRRRERIALEAELRVVEDRRYARRRSVSKDDGLARSDAVERERLLQLIDDFQQATPRTESDSDDDAPRGLLEQDGEPADGDEPYGDAHTDDGDSEPPPPPDAVAGATAPAGAFVGASAAPAIASAAPGASAVASAPTVATAPPGRRRTSKSYLADALLAAAPDGGEAGLYDDLVPQPKARRRPGAS